MVENTYVIGEADLKGFTRWWESHLPSYLILCCSGGEARLRLQFREYRLAAGSLVFISPDMFPELAGQTADFRACYCLLGRDFAETAMYGVPKAFYDCLVLSPVIDGGTEAARWMDLLLHAGRTYADFHGGAEIVRGLVHSLCLVAYNLWQRQYGTRQPEPALKLAEELCMRFYNLVFDHFTLHRDVKFYADCLCVTPNHLATTVRRICRESPKEAINRQVLSEVKYLLRNTSMTAGQIAEHLHFPDASYLCRFFRRHAGASLGAFRAHPD